MQVESLQKVCSDHDERDGGSKVSRHNSYQYDVHDAARSSCANDLSVCTMAKRSSIGNDLQNTAFNDASGSVMSTSSMS